MLEFDAGIFRGELPTAGRCLRLLAAISSMSVCLSGIGDRGSGEDAEFGLGIGASVFWSVVPFEALDQAPGFDGWKSFVE